MQQAIIFFDGVCNLCNESVRFIIKHDRKNYFLFAALQSEAAGELLKDFGLNENGPDSIVLLEGGKAFTKSTAALRICKKLSFPLRLLYTFIVVPAFVRDSAYNFVAANRYKWFGKKDSCLIPTPELKSKFL